MKTVIVIIKIAAVFAAALLPAVPVFIEYLRFRKDKEEGISHKRFRVLVFTFLYVIGVTLGLIFLTDLFDKIGQLRPIQWFVSKVCVGTRLAYSAQVLTAIILNFIIGAVFLFLLRFVRIRLRKKSFAKPEKGEEFSLSQRIGRAVIKFFYKESWFMVGRFIRTIAAVLSVIYTAAFILFLIPAFFGASWVPYSFIEKLFSASYLYPVLTLLALWEAYFFLKGISLMEDECPELMDLISEQPRKKEIDLDKIDRVCRGEYSAFFANEVNNKEIARETRDAAHTSTSEQIGVAVDKDKAVSHSMKEAYMNALDEIVKSNDSRDTGKNSSVLIHGSPFGAFSTYLFRYISMVAARGDNIMIVCNSDSQIDEVYDFISRGIVSLVGVNTPEQTPESRGEADQIWRIVKVGQSFTNANWSQVDDCSILITTPGYICSTSFEDMNEAFFYLLDTMVFIDISETLDRYYMELASLNTRITHVTTSYATMAKNGGKDGGFSLSYIAKPVHYVCFDDCRLPGIDKVLKNLLESDSIITADIMDYSEKAKLRVYNYEFDPERGAHGKVPRYIKSEEHVAPMFNMAVSCLKSGAEKVCIFSDDSIPFRDMEETLSANSTQIASVADLSGINVNEYMFNADDYKVILAVDEGNNLPETLRRYASMIGEEPALINIFSRPYMLRDYYADNMGNTLMWKAPQIRKIPVFEGTVKDVARKIMIKASSGGIDVDEIYKRCEGIEEFKEHVEQKNINAILRAVLEMVSNIGKVDYIQIYRYFEHSTYRVFDESGKYVLKDKVLLKQQNRLYDYIVGLGDIVMHTDEGNVLLPIPKYRLAQNFICGQNLAWNGYVYCIKSMDVIKGEMYVSHVIGGLNNVPYQYLQDREYHVTVDKENSDYRQIKPTEHLIMKSAGEKSPVSDVFISVFTAPVEVVTDGYYELDPGTLCAASSESKYRALTDEDNEPIRKQVYRRYGNVTDPVFSSENIEKDADLAAYRNGAQILSVKLKGKLGEDPDKTALLASVMLNEIMRTMFPSLCDSIAVCPVLSEGAFADDESAARIMSLFPRLKGITRSAMDEIELLIIEDSPYELGVITALTAFGDDTIKALFTPIDNYLNWYLNSDKKSDYLYFGAVDRPSCFDFESLSKIASSLSDAQSTSVFSSDDYSDEVCDFCGAKVKGKKSLTELQDGRRMCKNCSDNIVGNNKKVLNQLFSSAVNYLESVYNIEIGKDAACSFETTAKITSILKQHPELLGRGSDILLYGYVDDKNKIHAEQDIPPMSISELLVRELTVLWQKKNLPDIEEELAEGHIALISVQYLRFFSHMLKLKGRLNYYETTSNRSGVGYRRLMNELLAHSEFNNNPFLYLLKLEEGGVYGIEPSPHKKLGEDDATLGKKYVPSKFDRVLDGNIKYFYYERLSSRQQKAYDAMLKAIKAHEESVKGIFLSADEIRCVSEAIEFDHPEVFWYRSCFVNGDTVNLRYGATREEAERLSKQIEEEVPKYLVGIDDSMSAYDAALRIHTRVINSVDYDTVALNKEHERGGSDITKIDYLRSVCGVFLKGSAVCEGYARAVTLLMQRCGIECAEAAGTVVRAGENDSKGGSHAWTIAKIDGDYYYLDATWDDRSNTIQQVKTTEFGYDYFCITTEELLRTRKLDQCPAKMPMCSAVSANYYYHNDLVLKKYDINSIAEMARRRAKAGADSLTFKCGSQAVFKETMEKIFGGSTTAQIVKEAAKANKNIDPDRCCYTRNSDLYTITISFIKKIK